MKNICFCFLMHVPMQLRRYRFFEIGQDHYYYDDMATEEHLAHLVSVSYMPLLRALQEMIRLSKGKFHCGLAVTGTSLELMEQYNPELIDIIKELVSSRCLELVAMPYAYSLAAQHSETDFEAQLVKHADKLNYLFGVRSTTLFNTELLYSDEIAQLTYRLGYKTILAEGAQHILSYKSPNYVYRSIAAPKQSVLLRNMDLSDSLAFHFSDTGWPDYPTDANKFISRLQSLPEEENLINIWMGADAFGIYQNAATGIFEFLKALPYYALENGIGFLTPSEAARKSKPSDIVSCPYPMTWAGDSKGLSLFEGNDLQQEALQKLFAVAERVHLCQDQSLKTDWLLLQDANYLHHMNHQDRGESPFESAYDAFINYMNILSDFLQLVEEQYPTTIDNEELNALLKTINNQEKEILKLQTEIKALKKKK